MHYIAHLIRNRSTRNFEEVTKLRADRRWCLTGTPVQNKLGDLFSLTEFLKFHPLDTYANARKYILDPLSRDDPQGLENLCLALHTISLRRARQTCSSRRRSERVENVVLSKREKELYDDTRKEAREQAVQSIGRAQGDIILRAISTLRQICSRGNSTLSSGENCDFCGKPISHVENSRQSFYSTCGHSICHECVIEHERAEGSHQNGMSDCCLFCQEPVLCISEVVEGANDDSSGHIPMDWESSMTTSATNYSSKITKLVSNLRDLEMTSSADGIEPIKR